LPAARRAEVGIITDQLVADLLRLKVEIRCGVTAESELVLGLEPDSVVVANGSHPRVPDLDDGNDRLVSTRDVYQSGVIVSNPVVLFDTQGEVEGLATADWFTRHVIHQRLVDQGIPIRTTEAVEAFAAEGIVVRNLMSGRRETIERIGTVVSACGGRARDRLYRELLASGIPRSRCTSSPTPSPQDASSQPSMTATLPVGRCDSHAPTMQGLPPVRPDRNMVAMVIYAASIKLRAGRASPTPRMPTLSSPLLPTFRPRHERLERTAGGNRRHQGPSYSGLLARILRRPVTTN